jgi:hypothetical protein
VVREQRVYSTQNLAYFYFHVIPNQNQFLFTFKGSTRTVFISTSLIPKLAIVIYPFLSIYRSSFARHFSGYKQHTKCLQQPHILNPLSSLPLLHTSSPVLLSTCQHISGRCANIPKSKWRPPRSQLEEEVQTSTASKHTGLWTAKEA